MGKDCIAFTRHLLLFFLVYADSAHSQAHYYIRPSLNVHSSGDPCLTLAQFAGDSTSYLSNETNISLSFLPGNHSLDRELSLSHADNFLMTKDRRGNGTVFVECGSPSGRFNISETSFVIIEDLHFVGCGGNRISQVEQFIVKDTIFQGVEGRGTALVLNEVTTAIIARSSFLSNTHDGIFEQHDIVFDQLLDYLYLDQDSSLSVGGALYTAFSNISIVSSKFTDNTAEIGGALFAYNSSLHVVGSTYSYNRASFAGVMITSESSVNIDNSIFSDNTAEVHGGVMITYRDSFSISGTSFTNNSASGSTGVMLTYDSFFSSITDSTFSDNRAEKWCGVIRAIRGSFSIISSTFNSNLARDAGVMHALYDSSFTISNSTFINNSAARGGVMFTSHSSFNITSSTFTNNSAAVHAGVVMLVFRSLFNIAGSIFTNNSAKYRGGVMYTQSDSSFHITSSTFSNSAAHTGGVVATSHSSFSITRSTFTNNSADYDGGVTYTLSGSSFIITSSSFTNNGCKSRGGVMVASRSSFNIISSTFTNNSARYSGGVMITAYSSFNIASSTFTNNRKTHSGVIYASYSSFSITSSTFVNNSVAHNGGVIYTSGATFIVSSSNFTYNNAARGGVAYVIASSFFIVNSSFYVNKADILGGIMLTIDSSTYITHGTFDFNSRSLYVFNSNLTFSGLTKLENCAEPSNKTAGAREEGGVITSFQSTVIFTGVSSLSNNQAKCGGAILAIESKIIMYGEITIANNTAINTSGGGISLRQSGLEIKGNCTISGNHAMRGGGLHTTSSTVAVYQPWILQFINNTAEDGGGLYLAGNSKMNVMKPQVSLIDNQYLLIFRDNHANYGGAIYVGDNINSGTCSPENECFIQTLVLHRRTYKLNTSNILFSDNTASHQGANLFGGLLDRCIPSPFAEVYQKQTTYYSGISYLGNISNITSLDTISSLPVRVCFCSTECEPDCSYQPPIIKAKKGEVITVPLVAVDQVNHSVDANIISSLSSEDGGFDEGQQTQRVGRSCRNLTFNVFSPRNLETISLFADGPCGSATLSTQHLHIQFTDCTCPVGFEPLDSETRCECDCDSKLSPYITDCNTTNESLVRVNTNSWITRINDSDPPGYVIHPNCPFDYCHPPTEKISMNLNLPDGADAQCAYGRSGILCGACLRHLSLSLGSSRCLPCHSYWPAVLVVILLAAIIAGILLVTALLALNMTVAVGPINGFIFYANIVAANSAVFFPSSEPNFPTVFVAWFNLDIGFDVCFFDGLDAYTKTWFQLAFPVYIISLVIIVIILSEYSPRFAGLIGKRDPIATLATLILLSYTKLLSVTITALSFAVLDYPDGSQETVWLFDGNMKYFQGKHIALFFMALSIILIGTPYTILLFLWQWLVRAPNWKVFNWTRNTKLIAFISVHHAPYNSKYRYWTGLLLLMRVISYITASIAVSNSDNPQTALLVTLIVVGSLLFLNGITGFRVYKKSIIDVLETGLYLNLLAFAAFSLYDFKVDVTKQIAMAYASTIITFILLFGVFIYHVYLLVRKDQPPEKINEYPLAPIQEPAKAEVTHSVVGLSKPRDQSPPPEVNFAKIEVKELICTETPVYQ